MATYVLAKTLVVSTIPATTIPAASSPAVIVDAAMLLATIVPAWIVALASNLNGCHVDPSHWLISPVVLLIQMSPVLGVAGADAEMVVRFPPRVLIVMPSFSIAGVMLPFCSSPPRPPAPGAWEVTAPDPGSCAVCTVPAENPVSYGDSGTALNANAHSRGPIVSV